MSTPRRSAAPWLRRAGTILLGLGLIACAVSWAPGPAGAQTVYDQAKLRADCTAPSCSGQNLDPGDQGQGQGGKPGSGNGGGGGNGGGAGNGGAGGSGAGGGLGDTTGQIDAGDDEDTGGVANPLSISNPICSELSGEARERCRFGQGPESLIPISNYQLDIYADDSGSGTDAIVGNFQKMLAAIANGIWMILVLALKGVFSFLGWAFSLAPFSNERTTSRVDSGLENFYANFTSPWLVFGFVCLGAWALYRGVVRREVSQTAGGIALSVGLMLAALWIIHEPRDSIGRASGLVDQAALSVIAAPQSGSLSDPVGDYSQATARSWHIMTAAPWAALQFSDTAWALGPPNPELKDYMWDDVDRYCSDEQFEGSRERCETFRALHDDPKSNVELLLASSPGSESRGEEMWNGGFGDDHPDVIAKMSMQSGAGAPLRLPIVGLFAIGLLGALLLFMWIVIRLFVQTAIAFLLVLSAPIALFFPAFGEKGRAAFTVWGGTLIGAIIAKLVYAALLAIVLFGTRVIFGMVGSSNDGIAVTMGFLLASGFWWAVFLKRQEIAGFFSLSDKGEGGSGRLGTALGVYGAAALGRKLIGVGGRGLSRRAGGKPTPFGFGRHDGDASPPRSTDEEQASASLDERARDRLDSERRAAEETVGAGAARQEQAARLRAGADRESERARGLSGGGREKALANAERMRTKAAALERERRTAAPVERRAAKLLERANENEARTGRRWSAAEIAESREALRHNLDKPVSAGVHGHYVGKGPREYEALTGRERELAYHEVAARLRQDQAAFGLIADSPGGARGRASSFRRTRREAIGDDAYRAERAALKRLQKARRKYHHRRRTGVSR